MDIPPEKQGVRQNWTLTKGKARLTVDGEVMKCKDGDFVQVKCKESHKLEAVTDIEVMTIGVAINDETTKYKVER